MKKIFLILFIILFPLNVFADSGHSTIVMDNDSGRILYSNNIDKKMLIASTTKIMTCILTIENISLDKKITVDDEVNKMYGTNIYIKEGEILTVRDLLYGLMLRSGNDAAIVLSKNVFGSYDEFISKMNEKAKQIGMKNTLFLNPHGLDEKTENYSTSYDMAILAKYSFKNNIFKKIVSTKRYTTKSNLKSYDWYNRMKLINNYKYCVGGKNGYTPKSGKSLVSYASKDNLNLIIVSLDDSDIYENHERLYNYYFDKYKNYKIIDKSKFKIDRSLIDMDVYIKNSFSYPLKDDELDDVSTSIQINNTGKDAGKIVIKLNDNIIGTLKIYKNSKKIEDKNIFHRIKRLFVR